MFRLLTDVEIQTMVSLGSWYFQVDLQDHFYSDPYLLGCDGVDDLDNLMALIHRTPHIRVMADVGTLSSSFKDVHLEDVIAIRAAFVAIFGEVSKPNEFVLSDGVADINPNQP